jgi:cysteine-rich repeat protein
VWVSVLLLSAPDLLLILVRLVHLTSYAARARGRYASANSPPRANMTIATRSLALIFSLSLAFLAGCSKSPAFQGDKGGDGDGDLGGAPGDGDGDIGLGDGDGDGDGDGTGGGGNVLIGCGDGQQDDGEDCDDGNDLNGDGCSSKCEREDEEIFNCPVFGAPCEVCGNGIKESTEQCDDGNTANGDGCSRGCDIEEDWVCNAVGSLCNQCGNGTIEGEEVCDDQNRLDDDGCASDCLSIDPFYACVEGEECSLCGDGIVGPGEACDDGNNYSLDGCQFNCLAIEDGFTCLDGQTECQRCGNGRVEGSEACDDRNNEDGDGCAADCSEVEEGYLCAVPGTACYECGNGVQEGSATSAGGYEQCDDGNRDPGDGCSDSCQIEVSGETPWSCPVPGQPCVNCGNGTIDGQLTDLIHEECDDGNNIPGDGCNASCQLEPGAVCEGTQGGLGGNCIVCGDGVVEGAEQCDDGNRYDRDGCTSTCQPEDGWTCATEGESCYRCGNGIKEFGEACDDGNLNSNDGCSSACAIESGYVCDVLAGQFRSTCDRCGNGLIKLVGSPLVEQCDDGNTNSNDGCSSSCTLEGSFTCPTPGKLCNHCGNGVLEGLEKCDEGAGNTTAGCNSCTSITPYWTCASPGQSCTQCGNGVVEGAEKCDDGANASGDGCRDDCKAIESGWICPGGQNCTLCGNGVRDPGEECDDGNTNNTDGCAACVIDVGGGWTCYPSNPSNPDSRSQCDLCGNGRVRGDEACDDGNTTDGDGCDSTCEVETDDPWTCPASGGKCSWCGSGALEPGEVCDEGEGNETAGCNNCTSITPNWYCTVGQSCTECGNGIVEGNEKCDDPGSGACAADCKAINPGWICTNGTNCTQCGNGQIDAGEQCDDGNSLPGDGCSSTCQWDDGTGTTGPYFCVTPGRPCELCGDGILNASEECDDGNLTSNPLDGCSSTCKLDAGWSCTIPGVECNLCGDGVYQGVEQCDDGGRCSVTTSTKCYGDSDCPGAETCQQAAGDGCYQCKLEPGWSCEEGGTCSPNGCGDGFVAGGEQCDDGNKFSFDGCSATCRVEKGYVCPALGGPCALSFCGDGTINGSEQCDNGGQCATGGAPCTKNSDCVGTGNSCQHVANASCDSVCREVGVCGDGVAGSGEECDDGGECSVSGDYCADDQDCENGETCQRTNGDGCDVNCNWEDGQWACSGKMAGKYMCVPETGCGDGVRGHDEACDDGNNLNGDGCSATCVVEPLYECDGEVTGVSECTKVIGWVLVRDFNVSSVNPEALHYDPRTRSFVGYKSSASQPPVELCIDGTIIVHPTSGGNNGQMCAPGVPLGSGSCTTVTTTNPVARSYAYSASSLTGATYDPGSDSWYFLDSTGLARICDLPAWNEGLRTGLSKVALSGNGIAIGDDGRLYVAHDSTDTYRVYSRLSSVSGCGIGFNIAAGPVQTVTHTSAAAFDGIFSLSGLGMIGSFVGNSNNQEQFFRFFDLSGNLIAAVDETDTSIITNANGGALPAITRGITGAETATDGSGFVTCFNANNESCKLFGRSCSDDQDCQRTNPGTVCRTQDDLGNSLAAPYCWAPAKARNDYSTANTANVDVPVDVLANDTFAQSVCRGGNMSLVPDSTTLYGGTVNVGVGPTECNDSSFSSIDECLLYTPPSDGTCNIIDRFEYGSYLGGDVELFATVFITVSCDCGNGVVDAGEACDRTAPGWTSATCDATCNTISNCGNGTVEGNEQCDSPDRDLCTWDCRVAGCGDGVRGGSEECDDGNFVNGDGCNSSCKLERCGNGIVDAGEDCDNDVSVAPALPMGGDGCDSQCKWEPACGDGIRSGSEECDEGPVSSSTCRGPGNTPSSLNCTIPYCGDGVPDDGEECDDGNFFDGDGCTWQCLVEECGDGVLNAGEECDDGPMSSTTCRGPGQADPSLDCTVPVCGDLVHDLGEECDGSDGFCASDCTSIYCGNGRFEPENPNGEQCDDGNSVDGDGCSSTCMLEAFCGDGIVGPGEECDYAASGGGATPPEFGATCSFGCFWQYCGNGVIDPGEQCDAGLMSSTDCRGPGQSDSTLDCTIPSCGDRVVDNGEECDDGTTCANGTSCNAPSDCVGIGNGTCQRRNGDGCNNFCLIEPSCGNGIVEPGEECDNDVGSPPVSGDGCSSTCQLEGCGNGVVEPAEQCDPGVPGSVGCRLDCTLVRCGDGVFDAGEQCDDGGRCSVSNAVCTSNAQCPGSQTCNPTSGDGCSSTCQLESVCGDGVRDPNNEQCDDGNAVSGDGCTGTDRLGSNPPVPACRYEYCGNGHIDVDAQGNPKEECDDGNNTSGDGCSSTCKKEAVCGDGKLESPEQCDDGNKTSGDGCSSDCRTEASCGDGKVDPGEACDPAHPTNGPNCRSDCSGNVVVR